MDNICQSCAMPMEGQKFGREVDGSLSEDYCKYCYDKGTFVGNDTMEEMIEICVPLMVAEGMKEDEVRACLSSVLPTLKRWNLSK